MERKTRAKEIHRRKKVNEWGCVCVCLDGAVRTIVKESTCIFEIYQTININLYKWMVECYTNKRRWCTEKCFTKIGFGFTFCWRRWCCCCRYLFAIVAHRYTENESSEWSRYFHIFHNSLIERKAEEKNSLDK